MRTSMVLVFAAAPWIGACTDGDGTKSTPISVGQDEDMDGLSAEEDCDDDDASRGGVEVLYDGLDNDCDGAIDCDDTDFGGEWVGDVTAADVPALCDDGCPLSIAGNVNIHGAMTDLTDFACITAIEGYLSIWSNSELASLSGLEGLSSIGGGLTITDNPVLVSLTSLETLAYVGSLTVYGNDTLSSLSGLEGLSSVDGEVSIWFNASLLSLAGLEGLSSVGDVLIWYNPSLPSLTGLEGLSSVSGEVSIWFNDALTSLDGLNSLTNINGNLYIGYYPNSSPYYYGNAVLTDVAALHGLVWVGGDVFITHNIALTDEAARVLAEEIEAIGGAVTILDNN